MDKELDIGRLIKHIKKNSHKLKKVESYLSHKNPMRDFVETTINQIINESQDYIKDEFLGKSAEIQDRMNDSVQ